MGQPFMSVFAAFVNGLVTENPGGTGLAEVEVEWLDQFRKQLISASDVGRFLEKWNIRETHPKGGPVRTLVRYLAEHQQAGTHPPQCPPSKGRAKDTEHRRKSTEGKYI